LRIMRGALETATTMPDSDIPGITHNGTSPYPSYASIQASPGIIQILLRGDIPNNPFSTKNKLGSSDANTVYNMSGSAKGTLSVGGGIGWCYNDLTGAFWANTRTPGVNENEF
jgi:hypothetical protein